MGQVHKSSLPALAVAAVGVVYGDIGTSPLYALKEVFAHGHGVALTPANIIGVVSMIIWTLTIVVSIKYVSLILRADNNGEGGIMAMIALASSAVGRSSKLYPVIATRLGYSYSKAGLWGAEIAVDFIHNESNYHVYHDTTFARTDILQIGLYGGVYIHFYKSQLAFGLGWYARDNINAGGRMYNRIGYRYYFKEKWFALFNVKANYAKADYFEFGIGYKFLTW